MQKESGWGVESMSRSAAVAKRVQYAALPYRLMGKSRTEVMLVTSLGTRRWIIPKGWPQKGRAPHHSAAREAFEEAGVEGVIHRRSVGSFPYQKRLKNGGVVDCEVESAAAKQAVAGKRRAPGQVGVHQGSRRNGAGAQAEHNHPPLGTQVRRLRLVPDVGFLILRRTRSVRLKRRSSRIRSRRACCRCRRGAARSSWRICRAR